MIRYDTTITIDRPPDAVFERVQDVPRSDEWTDMTDARWITPSPIGVGSRARARLNLGPMRPMLRWEVTRHEPGRAIGFRTLPGGPLDWDATYAFEPVEGGTRIRSFGVAQPRGWLRLLTPLIAMEMPRGEARELDRLKGILEREEGASPTSAPSTP